MWNVPLSAGKRVASLLLTMVSITATVAFAAPLPTTTTLALSSANVASPAVVTLTASVTGGASPLLGTVNFCDASAPVCRDVAILGTAQVTAGTAILRLTPAIGSHAYKAQYLGTSASAASTSAAQTLTVTGLYPTTTTVTATGNPSGYALTATVVGYASQPPVLTGNVAFTDDTNNNLLLGTVALGTPVFVQTFAQAKGSPVQSGANPATIGLGDFNEDGRTDMAVVDAGSESISILTGNGDGTFTPQASLPAFGTPTCASLSVQSNCSIAVGDFDHDGHADFAVTSGPDNTISTFRGDGHAGFVQFSGSPISVGAFPEAVRIGDFNNDGIQDLVVANANDDTLTVLLGSGNGTFTVSASSPLPEAGFPFFLTVGDFNRDGNADLAIGNGRDNSVGILLGNGDATFTQASGSPIAFPTNAGVGPIVAADLNEDGIIDLAVANFGDPSTSVDGSVDILVGNGDGTFTLSSQSPIDFGVESPFAIVALDFNNDGHTDLAISDYGYSEAHGSVSVLNGDGHGKFALSVTGFPVGIEPNDLVAADFNGDGHPDLAIPESGDDTTTVLLTTVTQTATATLPGVFLPGAGTHEVKATYPANADFNTSFGIIDLQGFGGPTTLTLTDSPSAQLDTLSVTFTGQLSLTPGVPPTGTISFFDSGAPLATVPVSATGQALFTTAALGDGIHTITASYSGDAVFQSSNSNTLPITISDLVVMRVGNNNTTVIPGTTVVYKLQVFPAVATTFLYDVILSASGLPAGASATFSTPTLAAGSGTATVTMTIETSKTALNTPPAFPFSRLPLALGFLLPLLGTRRMRKRLRHPFLMALLLGACGLSAVAGLSGCAGAGLFAERKVPYAITVTATEGTPVYGSLQRSTGVPLAIQ